MIRFLMLPAFLVSLVWVPIARSEDTDEVKQLKKQIELLERELKVSRSENDLLKSQIGALAQLKGTWVLESHTTASVTVTGEAEGLAQGMRITVEGDRWVERFSSTPAGAKDEQQPQVRIRLDGSRSPAWIDTDSTNRPEGWHQVGIYKIEGDTLTICFRVYGKGDKPLERPNRFRAETEDSAALSVFKRQKPSK